jgi:hypothetical protein
MRTDSLIELLARHAGPAPRAVAARRLGPAAAVGLLASIALAVGVLGLVPRAFLATPAPWVKLAYAGALALAAGWLAARLARPVARTRGPLGAIVCVVAAMLALGVADGWATPAPQRLAGLLGNSWTVCPWNVLALSMPALAAGLWALRGLAPTRPRAAGAAVGLFAGGLGAFGYAFACTEPALAFVATWYTLGIAMTALAGAALGPRVLRW